MSGRSTLTAILMVALCAALPAQAGWQRSQDGPRNVYSAAIPVESARRSAVHRVMQTFFDGSPVKTVASFLDENDAELSDDDLVELAALIDQARKRGN